MKRRLRFFFFTKVYLNRRRLIAIKESTSSSNNIDVKHLMRQVRPDDDHALYIRHGNPLLPRRAINVCVIGSILIHCLI